MDPFLAGQPGREKGIEAEAHLRSDPPEYSASPLEYMTQQDRPRNACRPRFWLLLACSFLALCACYIIQNKYTLNLTYPFQPSAGVVGPDQCSDHVRWEKAQDVPQGYSFHSRTSVTLPMSADLLSVITQGARTHGSLEISQTSDVGSDAVVEVDVFYRDQKDFEQATVCRLHPSQSEWGFGIFTPAGRPPPQGESFHQLRFEVHLRLPAVPSLIVPHLKTDLHNFSQRLGALADSVHFTKLALKSTNGRISAESVAGDKLEFRTTNGAILGRFKTTSDLDLSSSDGRIDAKIALLSSPPHSRTPNVYRVTAFTFRAPLDMHFVDAPPGHALVAAASTTNARAAIALHEAFEGAFDLRSENAGTPPAVHARVGVHDPAGRGRFRDYDYDYDYAVDGKAEGRDRDRVQGNVWWDWERRARGRVRVSTSDAPLELTV
ncbi:hypothetical protein V8D89_001084 [Ganoderma adspersum]